MKTEDLQAAIALSPFTELLGLRIEAFDAHNAELLVRMPYRKDLARIAGEPTFHGGAIAAMVDTSASFLVAALAETAAPTANFRTDFLKPASGNSLLARAHCRRKGKRIAFVDVDVYDENSTVCAIGRGTFLCANG
ncbi:MAG: PaaI family thioesterase [Pseudomonadota bacterium]